MVEIEIHLTGRFAGDTVTISADGREILREEGVTTDPRIGLAQVVHVQLPPGRAVLSVEVPTRGLKADAALDPAGLKFVTIGSTDGQLQIDPVSEDDYRREPRGYA